MRTKIKILLRLAKRLLRRVIHLNFVYEGKNLLTLLVVSINYLIKFGFLGLIKKIKQTILIIDKRSAGFLHFPNGLVSGVGTETIKRWYANKRKKVTIIIPSYNDLEVLVPCLQSIYVTTNHNLVKVLVVDDYCVDEHKTKLKALENEQVKVVFRKNNGGFAKAVNTGIENADSRYDIVLLNSDTIAQPNWLEALQYGAYEFSKNIGIVGPKLLYPDGRIQSAGSHRNTENPKWFDHYYRFQDSNYGPANIPQYCIGVTGACMYVKRKFIKEIGVLDDNYQFAFEDMDWCIRGWDMGYKTLYFPASSLIHVESATRAKNKKISEKEKQSIEYFWSKWSSWFDNRNVRDLNNRIKLIFVLQTFGLSGGIKNVFEQANRLANMNYTVEIWGLDKNPPAWPVNGSVKIKTFKNYTALIKELSPIEAIKIATWWETAFPVWLSSIKKGRAVYFIQEFESWFYPDDVVAQSTVISCYRKEFINATISSYNLNELKNIGLSATILPCGYDDNNYKIIKSSHRKKDELLAVGRSFFQKNFKMTLEGWKLMKAHRPKLILYGNEPEITKADKNILYINKPTNEKVNELLNNATVFVQTSIHEGFCLPILEAMAAGCPVVCTDAHGNRDFCINNRNCIIVGQNDPKGLALALEKIFSDQNLQKRLAKSAKKTADKYKWDNIIQKVDMFYSRIA